MRFCLKQNLEGNLKIALAGKELCLPLFAPLIRTKLLYNKKTMISTNTIVIMPAGASLQNEGLYGFPVN